MSVGRLSGVVGMLVGAMSFTFTGLPDAGAATSFVNCPGDDLQMAITAASPGDTLRISGTCTGTFRISKRLTLLGSPGATLDGVAQGTTLTVTAKRRVLLEGLEITGGSDLGGKGAGIDNIGRLVLRDSSVSANRGDIDSSLGGAIRNAGSLRIVSSILRGNTLNGFFSEGGGIYNTGELLVWGSTLSGNSAYGGGNIYNSGIATIRGSTISGGSAAGAAGIENYGLLTVVNSTLSRNSSEFIGGIFNSGVAKISNATVSGNSGAVGGLTNGGGTMTLTNTTVSGNFGSEVEGPGGISNMTGTVVIRSSIVAGNPSVTIADCGGTLSSKGYNVIGDADGCTVTAAEGDLIGSGSGAGAIDPGLGPLADNGGGTQTMAVLSDSPARDAIPIGAAATGGFRLCPPSGTTDQRHVPRPQGPACDIGAFERKTH